MVRLTPILTLLLVLGVAAPVAADDGPDVRRYPLSRGLEVVQLVQPEVPTTRFLLVFPGGEAHEPPEAIGVGRLTASMLLLGPRSDRSKSKTVELHARTIDLGVEEVGGRLALGFTTVDPWVNDVLETLGRVLADPDFSSDALEVRVDARVAALGETERSPRALAWRAWRTAALGEHPAAGSGRMTEASLESIGARDLVRFHLAALRPDGALLLVAGPEPERDIRRWVQGELLDSGWRGEPGTPRLPVPLPEGGPALTLVHQPGLELAQVVVGGVGPRVDPPDEPAMAVLTELLAGDMVSRLNRRLRGELQLTYGVHPWRLIRRDLGALAVSAGVVHDDAPRAVRELLDELDRLATRAPPTLAEVKSARARVHTSQEHALATSSGAVGLMAELLERGWRPEALERWRLAVRGVGPQAVGALAERWLGELPKRVVVVGDADRLEQPLAELGLSMEVVRPE